MFNNKYVNNFFSSIFGGIFIALGALAYTNVVAGHSNGLYRLLGALIFSAGLVMTIRMGASIFTSAVLDIEDVKERSMRTFGEMLPEWGITILGNLIGALFVLIYTIGSFSPEVELALIDICEHKCSYDGSQLLALGFLCNLLVCTGALFVRKGFAPGYPEVLTILPVTVFVLCGFEHSVANMFFLPAGYFSGASVSIGEMIFSLFGVLLGNLYGGLFVTWYVIEKSKIGVNYVYTVKDMVSSTDDCTRCGE